MATRATEAAVQPIRVEEGDGGRHLHLEGRITVAQARRLREAALPLLEGAGPVTLHLDRAEYLDGAALQVLLALGDGLAARGRGLRVVSTPPSIDETLRAIGLGGALGAAPAGVPAAAEGRPS